MFKKFITFTLIFISLNILSAETKAEAESKQNYLEVNAQNVQYLKEILTQSGLKVADLQSEVLNYLYDYKCVKSFSYNSLFPEIECAFPNDNMIIDGDLHIKIVDINGNLIKIILPDSNEIHYCYCCLGNNRFAIGYNGGTLDQEGIIKIYDSDFNCIKIFKAHTNKIRSLCVLPNNQFASSSQDGTIKIWNSDSYECIKSIECPAVAKKLCLLENNLLVSKNQDLTTQLWDIDLSKCLLTLKEHLLCVLPNHKLALRDWEKIKILDINSQEYIHTLQGHSGWVTCACMISDKLLVTGSRDGTIRFWDINSGVCRHALSAHDEVLSLYPLSNRKFVSTTEIGVSNIINAKVWAPRFDLIESSVTNTKKRKRC